VPGATTTLPVDSSCGGSVHYAPSLAGDLQTSLPTGGGMDPATPSAIVAWASSQGSGASASDVLCAATLNGNRWSQATQLFAPVAGPPSTAMNGPGNGIVLANGQSGSGGTPSYSIRSAFLPAEATAWQVQPVGASEQSATPYLVFSTDGSVFAIWAASGSRQIVAARRDIGGTWGLMPLSSPTAVSTGYARIAADPQGNAVALYGQALPGSPMQIWSSRFAGGVWSGSSLVQDDVNEGKLVDIQRYQTGDVGGNLGNTSPPAAWRETDPTDPSKFRIVTSY